MAWWGWLLLLAYLPVAALQAVWLSHAIDRMERREAKRLRRRPSSARRRHSHGPHPVETRTQAEPSGTAPG